MRNPHRIPLITDDIKDVWEKFPEMRLGQLICNAINITCPGLYYMEDHDLLSWLIRYMKKQGEHDDHR